MKTKTVHVFSVMVAMLATLLLVLFTPVAMAAYQDEITDGLEPEADEDASSDVIESTSGIILPELDEGGITTDGVGSMGAKASVSASIVWTNETPLTQSAGTQFRYLASVSCSAVVGEVCASPVITIPLPANYPSAPGSRPIADWDWTVAFDSTLAGTVLTVDGIAPALVIDLPDMTPGQSSGVSVRVTPHPYFTPNGTTWTMRPELSGDNFESVTATNQLTSVVTNTYDPRIEKTAPAYVLAGGLLTFVVQAIDQRGTNTLHADPSFEPYITDVLPAGVTFVSATGNYSYNAATRTVTVRPKAGGNSTSISSAITVRLNAGYWSDGDQINNTATFTSRGIGEPSAVTLSASSSTTVVSGVIWGEIFTKTANGNLNGYYPGTNIPLASADASRDASYTLGVKRNQFTAFNYAMEDQLPCFTGSTASQVNPRPVGSRCTDPAFIVSKLTFDVRGVNYGIPSEADVSSLQAKVVYTDGSSQTFNPCKYNDAESYPTCPDWTVPAGKVVASVGLTGWLDQGSSDWSAAVTVGLYGKPSSKAVDLARISNTLTGAVALPGDTPSLATGSTVSADMIVLKNRYSLYVSNPPNQTYEQSPSGRPSSSTRVYGSSTTEGLVRRFGVLVPDELNPSLRFDGTSPGYSTYPNFEGSGKTLIVSDAPPSSYENPLFYWSMSAPPGSYPYEVFGGFEGVDLKSCDEDLFGTPAPNNVLVPDGQRFIGGSGTGAVCMNSGVITITSPVPGFSVQKTASNGDGVWVSSPGAAYLPAGNSTGQYQIRWTNTGPVALTNPVVYDILPYAGDTGVMPGSAARGSTVPAVLTALPTVPSGWSVDYSRSTNPCRPELGTVPGCTDDWTTAAPALNQIKALRFTGPSSVDKQVSAVFDVSVQVPGAKAGDFAWNTAASGASLLNGAALASAESPKVGLAVPRPVTPVAPSLDTDTPCDVEKTVNIPTTTGVIYEQTKTGNTVTVTARPDTGYAFPAGTTAAWTFDVSAEECPAIVPPNPPTMPEAGSLGFIVAPLGALVVATAAAALVVAKRRNRSVNADS